MDTDHTDDQKFESVIYAGSQMYVGVSVCSGYVTQLISLMSNGGVI